MEIDFYPYPITKIPAEATFITFEGNDEDILNEISHLLDVPITKLDFIKGEYDSYFVDEKDNYYFMSNTIPYKDKTVWVCEKI